MSNEMNNSFELPEDKLIYAPLEEIRRLEKVLSTLESIQRELLKVAEGLKPISLEK